MKRSVLFLGVVAVLVIAALGYLLFAQTDKLKLETQKREAAEREVASLRGKLADTLSTLDVTVKKAEADRKEAAQVKAALERNLAEMAEARQAAEKEAAATLAKLEEANKKIRENEKAVVQLEHTRDELTTQLEKLGARIVELEKTIKTLEKQLAAAGADRDRIERELAYAVREREVLLAQWNSLNAVRQRLTQLRQEERLASETERRKQGNRGFLVKDGESTYNPAVEKFFHRR